MITLSLHSILCLPVPSTSVLYLFVALLSLNRPDVYLINISEGLQVIRKCVHATDRPGLLDISLATTLQVCWFAEKWVQQLEHCSMYWMFDRFAPKLIAQYRSDNLSASCC